MARNPRRRSGWQPSTPRHRRRRQCSAPRSAANPKNLALTLAAAASIAEAELDRADEAIAVAVFVALGSVTVAGAVIVYLVDAKRAARPLNAIKRFMSDNNAVIMMVVLLLLGVKLLGDGLAVL